VPEPIKNVFDNPDVISEEKTIALVGPQNEVPMLESTDVIPRESEVEAPIAEDTRAPVGLDAGAPQVTDKSDDDGGWHGDAEAGNERDEERATTEQAPKGVRVEVAEMGLDEEAIKLAVEAMRAVEGEEI
jgi:dolichyl-phosphate-mannose-protein mannosyltransferase